MIDWESIARKAKYIIKDREATVDSYCDMLARGEINRDEFERLLKYQENEIEKNYRELHFAMDKISSKDL